MRQIDMDAQSWKNVRVGDLCQSINGRAFKSTEWAKQGMPIIRIQNLNRKDASFNYFDGTVDEKILVRSGDLLFAWSGTPGTSFGAHIWRGPDAALNQHIFKLRFDQTRVDTKYFYYALNRNVAGYIDTAQGGVGLAHVTKSKFENSVVPLPELRVQQEIVAEIEKHLSRLDEAVANLKRVKANLKRYKASVLKDAVEGRLVPTEAELARREGRSFETGEQLLLRILETRRSNWTGRGKFKTPDALETMGLVELPTGWAWTSVEQIADVISGLTKNPTRETLPLKLPYLRVANVYANELRLDDMAEIGVADNELQKLLVLKNDLLVVEGNGSPDQIGRVAKWDGSIAPCVHQNHLIKVRAVVAEPDWVLNWLVSPGGRKQIELVSSSTTGLHTLSSGKVGRLPVPLPPVVEQQRIVSEVDRRLSLIRGVEAEVGANLKRAQALRQATLQRSFGGNSAKAKE